MKQLAKFCALALLFVQLPGAPAQAQRPSRRGATSADASPKRHIWIIDGDLHVSEEVALNAQAVLNLLKASEEENNTPGYDVKFRALRDRAFESDKDGDLILVNAFLNLSFARLDNLALKRRIEHIERKRPTSIDYDLAEIQYEADPASGETVKREQACEAEIQQAILTGSVTAKMQLCEEADLDPVSHLPTESIAKVPPQSASASSFEIGAPCAQAVQYGAATVRLMLFTSVGTLGENISRVRIDDAKHVCRTQGELLITAGLQNLYELKVHSEIRSRLYAAKKYVDEPMHFQSEGDFRAWVEQSWTEVNRAKTVIQASQRFEACDAALMSALDQKSASAPIAACKIDPAA